MGSKLGVPKRSGRQQIADRVTIARLYLQGMKQAQIGLELGLSPQQIGVEMRAIHNEWRESTLVDYGAAQGRELAKIDQLEQTYWAAWERSQTDKKRSHQKARPGADNTPIPVEAIVTTELQVGDPRFLDGVQWCIERRCKLLGLDSPAKLAFTDPNGEDEFKGFDVNAIFIAADVARSRLQATDGNPSPDNGGFSDRGAFSETITEG